MAALCCGEEGAPGAPFYRGRGGAETANRAQESRRRLRAFPAVSHADEGNGREERRRDARV